MSSSKPSTQLRTKKSTVQFNGRDEQIEREDDFDEKDVDGEYKSVKSRRATQHINAGKSDVKKAIRSYGEDSMPAGAKAKVSSRDKATKANDKDGSAKPAERIKPARQQTDRETSAKSADKSKASRPKENVKAERNAAESPGPARKPTRKPTKKQAEDEEEDNDENHAGSNDDEHEEECVDEKKGNFGKKLIRQMLTTRKNTQSKNDGATKSEDPMFAVNVKMSAPSLTEAFAPVFVDATSLYLPSRTYNTHKDKDLEQNMAKLPTGKSGFAAIVESAFGSKVVASTRKQKPSKSKKKKKLEKADEVESDEESSGEDDGEEAEPELVMSDAMRDQLHKLAERARVRARQDREDGKGQSRRAHVRRNTTAEQNNGGERSRTQPTHSSSVREAQRQHVPRVSMEHAERETRPSLDGGSIRSREHERSRSHHRQPQTGGGDATGFKMEHRNAEQSQIIYVDRDGREVKYQEERRSSEESRAHRSHRHHHHHHQSTSGQGSSVERESRRHGDQENHHQPHRHHHHHRRHHHEEGASRNRAQAEPHHRSQTLGPVLDSSIRTPRQSEDR